MKILKFHQLSPIEQDNARSNDSECGWLEDADFLDWWSGESKPGGPALLLESVARRIQVISWLDGRCYYLLRSGSTRIITKIDYDDIAPQIMTTGEWVARLKAWTHYWDNFDREECAFSRAELSPKQKEQVRYEARRLGGWFLRYRKSDDILEISKRNGDGIVFYTGGYFRTASVTGPALAGESPDSSSHDSEIWQA